MCIPYTCQHLLVPLRVYHEGCIYSHVWVSKSRDRFPSVNTLLLSDISTHIPLLLSVLTRAHTDAHPGQTLTFTLDLHSILQGAKPNKPGDTILIPIIFLRIRLQICSLKVVCQAGEGCAINGEEGSREQPEKSGVKLTFWREPSTHSYYWFLSRKTEGTLSPSCWAKGRSATWRSKDSLFYATKYKHRQPYWLLSFKYVTGLTIPPSEIY